MRRIALFVALASVVITSGVFAQPRTFGARRLIIDNGAGTNTYVTSGNGLAVSVLPAYLPAACAILDLNANTAGAAKLGFLGPRVAEIDKINICGGTPPAGMLIYNSTFNYYEYFNGAVWAPVVAGWSLHGNGSTIPPAPSTTPSLVNPGDYFLGTLDAVDFAVVTDSRQRIRVEGDNAVNGNTVEILNDGATSTGLKIYANGGTGINIDPAATGVIIDATLTGIEFTNSQPGTGIDMSNGASLTGMIIDNTPLGIEIGTAAPGSQGIGVNSTVNGITVGNITAPNDGLDVNATSTGMLVGSLTQPNFGLDVDAAITGATFDAPTIGIDVGQSFSPLLGIGVQAVNTGIDVQMPGGGIDGINVNGPTFGTSINVSNVFGTGLNMNQTFGTGINMQQVFGNGMNMLLIGSNIEDAINIQTINANRGISLQSLAGSILGMQIQGYTTSIVTDGPSTFGDGGGADNHTFNNGSGDMTVNLAGGASDLILNGIDQPAIVFPMDNLLYLSPGNIVDQTPNGINFVSGSGTLNTVPLWTPSGFQLGNSIITQEANASGINVTPTSAGGANVVEINNFNNTQTGVKINANGGIGVDVDPASTGIIVDATVTGMLIDGSTPTTGININRAGATGLNIGTAVPPQNGITLDATNIGIAILDGPSGAGLFFNPVNSPTSFGTFIQSSGAGNMAFGHRISQASTGSISFGSHITTELASTGTMQVGYSIQHFGDAPLTSALLALNLSPNPAADMQYGLRIRNGGNADITTGASIVDDIGIGVIPLGMEIIGAIQGMEIQSTGGLSINANQNIVSTGGFGRFASGVATNTAAPNPLGNQITWSNVNSGTLSTQALTAPRTWLLPDETGVIDVYDPLNNNGFVYFQPEVQQVASPAGSWGNNNLIWLRGLATTPNGVVVDMSSTPLAGSGTAVVGTVAVTGANTGFGMYGAAFSSGSGAARGVVADAVAQAGSSGSAWGANFGATASGASSANLIGTVTYASGTNTTGSTIGGVLQSFGSATSGANVGAVLQAFNVNASTAHGVEVDVSGSTTENIGVDIDATGIGSIGVDINAGSRTGIRITDVDVAGASTGISIVKTTGGAQIVGMDVLAQNGTITDGYTARTAGIGVINRGFRSQGPNTGFVNDRVDNTGYSTTTTTGTGYEAPAVTSGVGYAANVSGDGEGVNVTVGGASTGRGVVSTNTSTAAASSAGEFVGNASNVPGSTNIAMQISRGDITVGREIGGAGHVETGINEGPSGVVSAPFTFLFAQPPGISQNSTVSVNVANQHARTNSIILITDLDNSQPMAGADVAYTFHVMNRANGSFDVVATRHSGVAVGQPGAITALRFGYLIINPDR